MIEQLVSFARLSAIGAALCLWTHAPSLILI